MLPAIFEMSIPKTPLGHSFMLFSGSAQLKQFFLHIRPTNSQFDSYMCSIANLTTVISRHIVAHLMIIRQHNAGAMASWQTVSCSSDGECMTC